MKLSRSVSSRRRIRGALVILALIAAVGALPLAFPVHAAVPRTSFSTLALSGSDVQHALGSGFKSYNHYLVSIP
jgi:hypothetical protein